MQKDEEIVDKLNFINKYRNEINIADKRFEIDLEEFYLFEIKIWFLKIFFSDPFEQKKKKLAEEVKQTDTVLKLKKKLEETKEERSRMPPLSVNKSEAKKQYNTYANQRVDYLKFLK